MAAEIKQEPAELRIEPAIKTEHFDDSSSSVEGVSIVSNAYITDWDSVFGEGLKQDSRETCVACPSFQDQVTDLSNIDESPVQPIIHNFPYSVIYGKQRRFTAFWYSKYASWLEYSVEKDAIFCKVCRHFGTNLISDKFIRGFRNWKRTHMACSKHELSKAHNISMCKYMSYKGSQQSCSESPENQVENQVENPAENQAENQAENNESMNPGPIQNNRHHLRVLLDIVMFCVGQQMAPIRQTGNESDPFHQLLRLLAKNDPRIQSLFHSVPKNKNFPTTGPDLANDLMDAAASLLLRQIKQELHHTPNTYYTILAEECWDRSKRQLVGVCVRYFSRESIRERVVGFVETGDVPAERSASQILQVLEPFELDPGLCVGFGFDGTSVMSEVRRVLKRTFTRALVVHRRSHRLSSVLCAASNRCLEFRTFLEAVKALCLFLSDDSYGQARFLEIQKEMYPHQPPVELDAAAQTHQHVAALFSLFDVVLETLAEFSERGGQVGLQAQSLLQQVQTKKFVFLLVASRKLFEVSEVASEGLQSETLALADCMGSILGLKQKLVSLRCSGFEQIFTLSRELADKNEIENWDVSISRKRKLQSRENLAVALSSRIRSAVDLRALWHQILHSQMEELDIRFHRDTFCLMEAVAALHTNDGRNLAEKIRPVCQSYSVEVSDLELFTLSQILEQTSPGGRVSLMEILDMCNEENVPNLCLLLRILLTLPITACSEERMSSSLNKLRSPSAMLTSPLNPLSLLVLEKDLTDSLDYDEIIDIFYLIKFIKPLSLAGSAFPPKQLSNR